MAYDQRGLDDYVDVAQRIADFRQQYPNGCLQPYDPERAWEQVTVTGIDKNGETVTQTFIVYTAAAYRSPVDPKPGIGMAWEVFPGRTSFTRGSELMNAETSAWGRAIIAALASDSKKGVASREEVRNRVAERDDGLPQNKDGSLSRSRTTEAEKDAAGVMTAAQMREHTALKPDRGKPAERGPLPPEDNPWERVIGPSFDPDGPGYERAKADVGAAKVADESAPKAAPAQAREPDRMPEPEGRGSPWPVAAAHPAGEAPPFASPAGPPEDQPGSSQPTQWRMAHIIANRKHLTGDQVHEKASVICDRDITSLKQCSYAEMQLILGQL